MNEYRITPEEAVALFEHASFNDFSMARDIQAAYQRSQSHPADAINFGYAACFYAGIIEGVRRERARRRKVSDNPHVQCAVNMMRDIKSDRTLSRICRFIQLLWMQEGQSQINHGGQGGV